MKTPLIVLVAASLLASVSGQAAADPGPDPDAILALVAEFVEDMRTALGSCDVVDMDCIKAILGTLGPGCAPTQPSCTCVIFEFLGFRGSGIIGTLQTVDDMEYVPDPDALGEGRVTVAFPGVGPDGGKVGPGVYYVSFGL